MWAPMVIVLQPHREFVTGVGQAEEHLDIQTLVAQLAIEAFDIAVLDRSPWPNEVQIILPRLLGLTVLQHVR